MNPRAGAPILSVIIPAYNRAGFLRDCIRSLQGSGVESLEIIVIDDGSTDETAEVLRTLSPDVIAIRQENQGMSSARNVGFLRSRGRYVTFLDSDDQWLPGVAGRMIDLLDRHRGFDILFADSLRGNPEDGFHPWIEVPGRRPFRDLPHHEPEPGLLVLDQWPFFQALAERNLVFTGAMIMRREVFEISGMFAPELSGTEDWELCLRMASRCSFGFWPEPMTLYFQHNSNLSRDKDLMARGFVQALRSILRKCPHLGEETRRWVEHRLGQQLFYLAYAAYDVGNFRLARSRFADRIRECGPEARSAAYWLLCSLPYGLPSRARSLKHRLGI